MSNLVVSTATPSIFKFESSYQVRVVLENNEPWFCLRDVCDILSIDHNRPISRFNLNEEGVAQYATPTSGGKQQMYYITEGNVYRLVCRSRKPEAKAFEQWVFDDVLPAIRKTGRYERQPTGERLTHTDMINIRRLFWAVSDHFSEGQAWANALWACLREATGRKSPSPFYVSDLPAIEKEMKRIASILQPLGQAIFEAKKTALKRVIRNREDAEAVMKDIKARMENQMKVKWTEDSFTEEYFRFLMLRLPNNLDAVGFSENV